MKFQAVLMLATLCMQASTLNNPAEGPNPRNDLAGVPVAHLEAPAPKPAPPPKKTATPTPNSPKNAQPKSAQLEPPKGTDQPKPTQPEHHPDPTGKTYRPDKSRFIHHTHTHAVISAWPQPSGNKTHHHHGHDNTILGTGVWTTILRPSIKPANPGSLTVCIFPAVAMCCTLTQSLTGAKGPAKGYTCAPSMLDGMTCPGISICCSKPNITSCTGAENVRPPVLFGRTD